MGQKDKARAIVKDLFEFSISTSRSPEEVIALATQVAGSIGGKLVGGFRVGRTGTLENGGQYIELTARGPGGLVSLMSFDIFARERDGGGSVAELRVGDFLYKKGSLGLKPTINAKPSMKKYVTALHSQLTN